MIQTLFGSVEQEPSLLERLKTGVAKTRAGLVSRLEDTLAGRKEIDADLIRSFLGSPALTSPEPLDLAAVEKRHIARILKLTAGNKTEAARVLGLDRKTLQRKGF